jgi:hypothetical protein
MLGLGTRSNRNKTPQPLLQSINGFNQMLHVGPNHILTREHWPAALHMCKQQTPQMPSSYGECCEYAVRTAAMQAKCARQ